jgi:hypothetical protein
MKRKNDTLDTFEDLYLYMLDTDLDRYISFENRAKELVDFYEYDILNNPNVEIRDKGMDMFDEWFDFVTGDIYNYPELAKKFEDLMDTKTAIGKWGK